MGFVNFLTYIKHLGEKALVFFPSKTDLITITDKNGEVTEELLSERLEAINNKIEKQNLLKNVAQYTKENPLVYTFNKNFSTTCTLEAGKQYSLSFDYVGELSPGFDEVGFTYRGDNNDPNTWDDIDIINGGKVYYDDFYFQPKFSGEYTFYWNMFDEDNKDFKIYNLKVVEGYSPEMIKTVEEIKKLDKSKLENVDNIADKDKFVKGLIDASDTKGTRHIFANWAGSSGLPKDKVQYFTTFSAKDAKDSELRPLSLADTKTVLGLDNKQNITNGIVTGDVDWNTLTTAGAYKIEKCNMTEANHAPIGVHNYGILHVIVSGFNNETRISQIYIPDTVASDPTHGMRIRTQNVTNWAAWHILMTDADGVKKSGDTMTGNLQVPVIGTSAIKTNSSRGFSVIKTYTGDDTGDGISIGGGGMVVIGSGESSDAVINALKLIATKEQVYITSDETINFYTNCQNIANRELAWIDHAYFYGRGFRPVTPTSTWIRGVTGYAGINAIEDKTFNCLAAGVTNNGRFGIATYEISAQDEAGNGSLLVYYMDKDKVAQLVNSPTYQLRLLTDQGNSAFPGTVTARKFSGTLMNLAPNDRYESKRLNYTLDQIYSLIANSQWEELPIGSYFDVTINSSIGGSELVDFVIAHINPYTNRGSIPITQPHVAIVPLNAFKTLAPMNAPSVELKNASDNVKTENHYIGTVSDIPSGTSDSNRTTGIGTSSGNTIITNKYNASVDDIIYVENSSLVEIGYYKVIGSGGVGKIIFDKGTMPITPNVEYLGMTYTIGKGNSTAGGYVGSDMYTKTLPAYEAALKTVFGEHMLQFTTLLTTSVDMNVNSGAFPNQKGAANGWEWKNCYLRLMNEVQIYGTKAWSSSGYDVGEANFQFALFQHDPANMIAKQGSSGGRIEYWLSSVASGSYFCHCDRNGQASCTVASSNWGVRPYFLLG